MGGTAGAVSGAWNGLPSEQVAALHQPIERARREQAMQGAMAKRVLQEGAAMPHYHPTLAEIWTYPAEELAQKIVKAHL